jgi:light-regulated signal transduction histidine kinase (bacteriophytochrome)
VEPGLDALLDGHEDDEDVSKEITLGKETDRRDYSLALSALRDRKGGITGYLLVLHDITERRRAERELEHFAYLIAHDLRAPLRTISGFSQVLAEDYDAALDEVGKNYLARTRSAARHMGDMIDDLLDLSRLTRSEMRRETVDLTSLAAAVAEELRQGDPDRSVEFGIAEGLAAEGDPRLLRVALGNLLENAWKFTAGEQQARIEFGSTSSDGYPAYYVRDNGAGFDMAYSGKLFRAFQRLHTTEEFEGTGIGLAAAARVIERHGGRIWAEGKVGEGATFYFTL